VEQYYNATQNLVRDEKHDKFVDQALEKTKKEISHILFDDAEIIFSTLSGAGML
jgi:hypothetical protein